MHLTFPIRSTRLSMNVEVSEHLHHEVTPFQTIDIYDTPVFGRVLFLDGHVQLSEFDEFAYHEMLVHVPMLSVDSPTRALVVGGGDGGVVRELCKHRSLRQIHMVEIDEKVIEASKRFLPTVHGNAFEDSRLELFVEDAFQFAKQSLEPYDLIVMDSTDVYEDEDGGLSEQLWTPEFYADLHRLLSPKGFLVTQADNLVFCPYSLQGILETFGGVFSTVGSYHALVPSFGGFSGYAFASHGPTLSPELPQNHLNLRYLNSTTYSLAMSPLPFG